MARFDETVNIQGVARADSRTGAPEFAMSLADKLETFKNESFARAETEAIQRGTALGEQAELTREGGITQAPALREEQVIGGIEIKAHNKALQAAYLSSLNNDNREAIGRISAENPDSIIGFNESIESYRKGVLDSIEVSMRPLVAQDLDNKISSARIQVQGNDIRKQDREAAAILSDGAEQAANASFSAVRNGDIVLAGEERIAAFGNIDALVESGKLGLDKANSQKREIDRELTEQGIRRGIDPLSSIEAYAAIDELSKNIPEGWTPDEWDFFMDDITRDTNKKLTTSNANKTLAIQDFNVQERLNGDDTQVLDQKSVNRVYDATFAEADNGQKAFFVDRTKTVPKALKDQINSDLLTGNPDVMIGSLDMINRIDSVPGLADPFTAENRAFAEIATELSKNLEPREAIKIAKEQTDPRNTKRIEAAQDELDKMQKKTFGGLDYSDDIDAIVEGGIFGFTNIPLHRSIRPI